MASWCLAKSTTTAVLLSLLDHLISKEFLTTRDLIIRLNSIDFEVWGSIISHVPFARVAISTTMSCPIATAWHLLGAYFDVLKRQDTHGIILSCVASQENRNPHVGRFAFLPGPNTFIATSLAAHGLYACTIDCTIDP